MASQESPQPPCAGTGIGSLHRAVVRYTVLVVMATVFAVAINVAVALGPTAPPESIVATGAVSSDVAASTLPSATAIIGTSVNGRPIALYSFGSGTRRVLLVGGMHGNEYGADVAEKFVIYLAANPSAVPSGTALDVVACANPDGRAAGRRTNAHNVDLNRNFPSHNWSRHGAGGGASAGIRPDSEPETRALVSLMAQNRYARVIALHSKGGLIDYDGKGGWTLAKRIGRAAHVRVVRLAAFHRYHGSLGKYVPEKLHAPVATWELASRKLTYRVRVGLLAAIR